MKVFWSLIYNLILYPLLFTGACIASFFHLKLRQSIKGKFYSISKLKLYFKNIDSSRIIYWFHSASLGEYHQVLPILKGLKEVEPEVICIVSFSSPSGYENATSDDIDFRFYIPFDFIWTVRQALKIIRPKKVIFASYDIWPNLIWSLERMAIHSNIFAAIVKDGSLKSKFGFRSFYKTIYCSITTIYTVAKKDYDRIRNIVGHRKSPILRSLGNPRYDMVKQSSDEFTNEHQKSVLNRDKRIIIGSAHTEDDGFLIPVLLSFLQSNPDWKVLYAPHEPNESEINRIKILFSDLGIEPSIIRKDTLQLPDDRVVILGIVGVLSKLYWQGMIAYVGGGFSTGIHNVMEPAIARLPVIFGPKYHHAHEGEQLLKYGGGFCIQHGDEFITKLRQLAFDESYFMKASFAATDVIHNNLGSATRIIRSLIRD